MFRINRQENRIQALEPKSFSSLGFRERDHLQEWIANNPEILGEDLLIIQKEFSGFDDTLERLDLLALDKQGALVLIENKLDDSGKDVTWQSLKYASYCSSLSKTQIAKIYQEYLDKAERGSDAKARIAEFYDGQDFEELELNKGVTQRIILIAGNFRKEATSTVLWLLNYKIRIQCFRVTMFSDGEELFLSADQIIPTQDTEEYMIGIADKVQEDARSQDAQKTRHILRKEYWTQLLKEMNSTESSLYQNISPGVYNWISAGSGLRGVGMNFAVSGSYARAELYIDRGEKTENKWIFRQLEHQKDQIQQIIGSDLSWEYLENRRASRIKSEIAGNVFEKSEWPKMIEFSVDAMVRLEQGFSKPLAEINNQIKAGNVDFSAS